MSPRIFLGATLSGLTLCLACGSTVHEATGGGGGTSGSGGTSGKGGGSSGVGAGGTGAGGTGVAGTAGASGGKAGTGGTGATGGTSPTGGAAGKAGGGGSPGGQCKSTGDCVQGQQCNLWDTSLNVTKCSMAVGNKPLGTPCSTAVECLSGMCFDTFAMPAWNFNGSKTCSVFCKTDADCGSGNLCVDYLYPGDAKPAPKRQCMKQCSLDTDCPATGICAGLEDPGGKRFATVCNGPEGAGKYGDDPTVANGCQTSLATKTYGTKFYCSKTCATQSDCPPVAGNLVQCVPVPYTSADKSYTTNIKSCY
jgi:hypothetical protein